MQPKGKKQTQKKKVTPMHMVGAVLSMYRTTAGLTQQQVAERLCVSTETIASVEQGRRPLHPADARQLDQLLETRGALAVLVAEMPERDVYPQWSYTLIETEERARSLQSYENHVVPGLLQTEEYARAVLGCEFPPVDEEEVERRVAGRMDRQQVLRRTPPPALSFVIEETVLRRPIGGRDCLRRQVKHLRECAGLPFVGLTVMPLVRETHAALSGPMVLMETPELERIAYSEGQRGSVVVDDPEEVSALYDKYGMLRSQALDPEETLGLLDEIAGEL